MPYLELWVGYMSKVRCSKNLDNNKWDINLPSLFSSETKGSNQLVNGSHSIVSLWKSTYLPSKNFTSFFILKLTLVLLTPDMPCLCKQCRSRSVGFWRSQLIWICIICHEVCEFVSTTWITTVIDWKIKKWGWHLNFSMTKVKIYCLMP